MSIKLLQALNGSNRGKLHEYIKSLSIPPRIAWYPSSGSDFRDLLFLSEKYTTAEIGSNSPSAPEIFIHTDYYPWSGAAFIDSPILHDDKRTRITVKVREELPSPNLPLDKEILSFPKGGAFTGRAFYLELLVESHRLGIFTARLIYAFVENEAFCARFVMPNHGSISHIIRVVYGSGFGGGLANGAWLLNVIPHVGCEVLISDDRHYSWQKGDIAAVKLYPNLGLTGSDAQIPMDQEKVFHSTSHWHPQSRVLWYRVKQASVLDEIEFTHIDRPRIYPGREPVRYEKLSRDNLC